LTGYYLDTSVQIERWFGAQESRVSIGQVLNSGEANTSSTHVRREWKRFVEQSAIDILNTLTSEDPHDDIPRLAQGYGREPNRRTLVLFNLVRDCGTPWTRDELRARARQMLEFRSEEMFEAGLSAVRDGSQCGLAESKHFVDSGGHYGLKTTCSKGESICRQPEALEEVLDRWQAGSEALKATADFEVMGKAGLKMAADKGQRKGRNCYATTGDLSVAISAEPSETILTTDASFEVIGPAIDRDVMRLPATSQPPRAKQK
jgi:hypothetical protein